ncbi:MAG: hypothetical protein HRU36_04695 [Rickettsiales bacterium]|nr:hypothetical protein [Rickettsiales bacterium]
MRIFNNIINFLKRYSLSEIIKFVLVVGLFIFIAFLLLKFLLIFIIIGLLARLIAPYFGFSFSKMRFKNREPTHFKVVGEEEQRREREKMNK